MQASGYTFQGNNKEMSLRGDLLAALGDTPAVAKVGGFKEGVGFADKKCRHCLATGTHIQNKVSYIYMHHLHNVHITCITHFCLKFLFTIFSIAISLQKKNSQ